MHRAGRRIVGRVRVREDVEVVLAPVVLVGVFVDVRPSECRHDDVGVHVRGGFQALLDAALAALDVDHVAIREAIFGRRIGMDFDHRLGLALAHGGYLAIARQHVGAFLVIGQDEWIVLEILLLEARRGDLLEGGQRAEPQLFHLLGIEFGLARWRREIRILVLQEVPRRPQDSLLHQLLVGQPGFGEHEVQAVLPVGPEMLAEPDTLRQLVDHLGVRPGFAGRLDHLLIGLDVPEPRRPVADRVVLVGKGGRQHDIGDRREGGREYFGDDQERHFHERFVGLGGVRVGQEGVGHMGEGHFDRVGVFAEDRPHQGLGRDVARSHGDGELLADRFLHRTGKFAVEIEAPGAAELCRLDDHLAAMHADVAGQGAQDGDGAADLQRGHRVLEGVAPQDLGRFRRCVDAGNLADGRGVDPRLGRHVVEGEGGDFFSQLVEAGRVRLDIVLVVEVLFDDHLGHAHGQGAIRTGFQTQPVVGLFAITVLAGLHHDQLAAAAQRGVQHVLAHATETAAGVERVGAPNHHAFHLGFQVGLNHHGAESEMVRRSHLHAAIVARRDHVRRLQVGAKALPERELHALGLAQDHGDALGSEFIAVENELFGNGVEGLVPGNPGPTVLAPLAGALHRIFETIGMRKRLGEREGTLGVRADVAVKAAFLVGLHPDHFAVFHGGGHGAMIGAQETKYGFLRRLASLSWLGVLPWHGSLP